MLCGSWHAATVDAKGADMNTNKALVLAGIKGVFIDRDPTVLDRLFSDDYQQHNPKIPNGTAAIKALLGNLRAAAGRATSERLREDVCAFRLGRGPQLHGVRPDLCSGDYLFYGAGNVDGRGCDTEQNRPTNLQISLRRKG
jgi:hypothetical protein